MARRFYSDTIAYRAARGINPVAVQVFNTGACAIGAGCMAYANTQRIDAALSWGMWSGGAYLLVTTLLDTTNDYSAPFLADVAARIAVNFKMVVPLDDEPRALPVNTASGTQIVNLKSPADDYRTAAIDLLSATLAFNLPRPDQIARHDKCGLTPAQWTLARDCLMPLVATVSHRTMVVSNAYPTVRALLEGVRSGAVVPSPTGATVRVTHSTERDNIGKNRSEQ